MPLVNCPDCGKSFSDRANACPECGCPISAIIGVSNNENEGQLLIANNAFNDSRYEEAYQLFSQIYTQDQSNTQVIFRLGLTSAAKDCFANGIPNSTKDLFSKGLEILKGKSTTIEEFYSNLLCFVKDSKKVHNDIQNFIQQNVNDIVNQMSSTRSTGRMFADALFMPAVSANRNLYEDRRTIDNNKKIVDNAVAIKEKGKTNLREFYSYMLNLLSEYITEKLDSESDLYKELGDFVSTQEESTLYMNLSNASTSPGNVFGVCYGEERELLHFYNNTSFYQINGKNHATGFAPPKGELILTNYKVTYTATKGKFSFEKSLDTLKKVTIGGPGTWMTHIALLFEGNIKVLISPDTPGQQGVYVAMIKEILNL